MDLELLFKLLILIIQLAALCAVAAWIADHLVQPMLDKRSRRR